MYRYRFTAANSQIPPYGASVRASWADGPILSALRARERGLHLLKADSVALFRWRTSGIRGGREEPMAIFRKSMGAFFTHWVVGD